MAESVGTRIDVREIDGEPFSDIVAALDELGETETLELIAPFEPVPLYGELENRGFTLDTDQDGGLYRVFVEHAGE